MPPPLSPALSPPAGRGGFADCADCLIGSQPNFLRLVFVPPPGVRARRRRAWAGSRAARTRPNRRPRRRRCTTSEPSNARRAARGRATRQATLSSSRVVAWTIVSISASTTGSAMPDRLREPSIVAAWRAQKHPQLGARRHAAAERRGDDVEIEVLGAALVLRRVDDARMRVDAELAQVLLERRPCAAAARRKNRGTRS